MTEEMRPIRCHHGRCTPEPCMEPATVEVLGPKPSLYCEEHARYRAEENLSERWEQCSGVEEYARDCEAAVSQLYRWEQEGESAYGVLWEVLTEARTYLELYELRRAREELRRVGGKPHATEEELARLEYFEEGAKRFRFSEEPPWVARVREYVAAAR